MIEGVSSKGHNTLHKLWASSKVLFGRQRQGAEAPGASGEGLETSQEKFIAYSVVKTGPYHQDVSCYHPETEGDSRSSSATKSAEAGHAYCFVSLTLYSRIRRQPLCSFCCFGEPTPSILAAASTATADPARAAARRESAQSPSEGFQRGV
jgi:hypothetical protein